MAKALGLSKAFSFDVPESAIKPVELGDYLDEVSPTPQSRPQPVVVQPQPILPPEQIAPPPSPVPSLPQERPHAPTVAELRDARQPKRRKQKRKPQIVEIQRATMPRKQVNMTPETLNMLGDLLIFVRTYSVQKDLKASEFFHGLVLALHEARPYIDLSRVQPRGQWGTPTAAALPVALKNAFQRAIRDCHEAQSEQ